MMKMTTRPLLSSYDSQPSPSRTEVNSLSLVFSVHRPTVEREVQTSQATRWQGAGEEEVQQGVEVEQEEEVEEAGAPGKSEVVTSPGAALGKSALEMSSR